MMSNHRHHQATSSSNILEYGPIKIRQIRKSAPTIATGRRSKHLVLVGEEAIKREQRREKNREAARKLKEKRQLLEEELDQKLKELQGENVTLQNDLHKLQDQKRSLEQEINNRCTDPLNELLSNHNEDVLLLFDQYLNRPAALDESIEKILDFDLNTDSNSVKHT